MCRPKDEIKNPTRPRSRPRSRKLKRGVCTEDRVDKGKALLHRIVSILTKLVMRFAPATEVREDVVRYNAEDDDEDDYE